MIIHVFYAGLLYETLTGVDRFSNLHLLELPDGAYIRYQEPIYGYRWYRSDFTPLADEHVPKELLVLALLLT